jgi:hypothetical protein
MTAPGDLIGEVQGAQVGGLGLGGDPDLLDGVHQLETGRHTTGSRAFIHGPNSHSEVLSPDTTAWANVLAVVQGAPFVPTADQQWVSTSAQGVPVVQRFDPYQDPDFSGTAKEDFPR